MKQRYHGLHQSRQPYQWYRGIQTYRQSNPHARAAMSALIRDLDRHLPNSK